MFGWNSFSKEALLETVDHITAVHPDTLVFHLKDGTQTETKWENRSRAESWTPEMREKAAEQMRRRHHG